MYPMRNEWKAKCRRSTLPATFTFCGRGVGVVSAGPASGKWRTTAIPMRHTRSLCYVALRNWMRIFSIENGVVVFLRGEAAAVARSCDRLFCFRHNFTLVALMAPVTSWIAASVPGARTASLAAGEIFHSSETVWRNKGKATPGARTVQSLVEFHVSNCRVIAASRPLADFTANSSLLFRFLFCFFFYRPNNGQLDCVLLIIGCRSVIQRLSPLRDFQQTKPGISRGCLFTKTGRNESMIPGVMAAGHFDSSIDAPMFMML